MSLSEIYIGGRRVSSEGTIAVEFRVSVPIPKFEYRVVLGTEPSNKIAGFIKLIGLGTGVRDIFGIG